MEILILVSVIAVAVIAIKIFSKSETYEAPPGVGGVPDADADNPRDDIGDLR